MSLLIDGKPSQRSALAIMRFTGIGDIANAVGILLPVGEDFAL